MSIVLVEQYFDDGSYNFYVDEMEVVPEDSSDGKCDIYYSKYDSRKAAEKRIEEMIEEGV